MKDFLFKDKEYLKKLIGYALPICLQTLMSASVAAADAFMLGGIEQNSMSAVSLASQIQFIQNMVLSGIVTTTSILGAQYWGKKDIETMDDIFVLSIRLSVIVCITFFIGCYFFPEKLMLFYTNDQILIEIGKGYLKKASISYLLVGISQSYIVMTRVSGHIKASSIVSVMAVTLNIILNYVFIYGFDLGASGAAYATDIARIIELLLVLSLSFMPTYFRLKVSRLFSFNKLLTIDFIKCMWPLMGACLLWGVGFTSYTSFMGHLGSDAAAANSITSVIRDLICSVDDGIANGGSIMIGNELGAGNLKRGKLYGQRMVKIAFIVGFITGGSMLITMPFLKSVVSLTSRAYEYLLQMSAVMSIYMIGRAVNTIIINGVFSAGGDTVYDAYSLFISMWCIALPLAYLGTYIFNWPVVIIYACTCLDEVGKIPWTLYHFCKYKWVKDLTR